MTIQNSDSHDNDDIKVGDHLSGKNRSFIITFPVWTDANSNERSGLPC